MILAPSMILAPTRNPETRGLAARDRREVDLGGRFVLLVMVCNEHPVRANSLAGFGDREVKEDLGNG
jgi:hypothetical protein